MCKDLFFDTFGMEPLESHYCIKGANNICPNRNIPKNCNKCDKWEQGVHLFHPTIILSQYMDLMKIAMRWGCLFGHDLSGKYYCYDNDEPERFSSIYTDTIEECILRACIQIKENCYEEVRKIFGVIPDEECNLG